MIDKASAIKTLQELHPRPRIGQRVKLKETVRLGEVIAVRRGRDVIRFMDEVQALQMHGRLQAAFGSFWIEVYYEADILVGDTMFTVNTMDVVEVLESV